MIWDMIWCVWVRRGHILGWKLSTFRPASWLLPLLLSPSSWLQAQTWDNGVNIQSGVAGVTYTAGAGTVTPKQTVGAAGTNFGTLEIANANPTTAGYALLGPAAANPVFPGWVRVNGTIGSSARYEVGQLYTTSTPSVGIGQGNYTGATLPSAGNPILPASPIAATVQGFAYPGSGGTVSVTAAGNTLNGGRIQNLLVRDGSNNFNVYYCRTGTTGDAGYNPLTQLGSSIPLNATANQQGVAFLVLANGTTAETVTAQYWLSGNGAVNAANAAASISASAANAYSYYTQTNVTAGNITLNQGEVVELQGSLTVNGTLNGTTLSTVLIGGHGTSTAGVTLNGGSMGSALTLVVQDDPTRTFPITAAGAATLSNSLVLVGTSQVSVSGANLTINLADLKLWSGSSLNVTSAIPLTTAKATLGGSLTGASGQTYTLATGGGTVYVPTGATGAISVPVGTVVVPNLEVENTATLTVTTGTYTGSGTQTIAGSTALSAVTNASLGSVVLQQGAQLSLKGACPTTITTLTTGGSGTGGVLSKDPVAGAVTVNTVTANAGTLGIVANGTDTMTLGSTGGVNITNGTAVNVSGSGNVVINGLTGGAGSLNLSGSGTRTFTNGITANAPSPGLTVQTSVSNPLTIPATVPVTITGQLNLQGPVTFLPTPTLNAGVLGLNGSGVVVNQVTLNGGGLAISGTGNTINNLILAANASASGTGSVLLGNVSGGNTLSAAGTVLLNGTSNLTGAGTTVSGAPLKLTGNPVLGAGTVLIGNPTLEIAASLTQNLAPNQISATNQILFTANSRLAGSGTIAATGAGSTIQVNSPATVTMAGINLSCFGATTIAAGARLGGVGTLTTAGVTVNGTLSAGDPVGTLNVTGPVTFGSNGIFTSTITGSGVGLLNVTGAANLAGNLDVTLNGRRAPIGSVFTVIQATSVNGTFASASGQAGLLTFEAIYTPTEVQVAVIYPPNGICSLVPTCTAAQAVACAIDEIVAQQCYGPVFEDFLYNEVFYPVSHPTCVLQQLSGGPYTDLPQLAGLQLLASQDVVRSAQWMALDRWDCCSRQYGWLTPTGDEISSESWRFRAAGVQGGYEKIWSSGWGLGIMGMAEAVSLESKTCTMKGHGGNFGVTPVLSWVPSWRSGYWRSYVWASGTVGGLVTNLRRDISWTGFCCSATSDWNPINVSGRLEGGLSYQDCTMALQPFAALCAFKVGAGSIQEEACCPAGLDVGCWQDSFGLAEIGFRWRDALCLLNTTFAPELDLGVYALMWGRGSEMSAKFQQADCACWSLRGPSLSRYGAFGGFGLQGQASDHLTIGLRVDGRFAKEYTAWIGTAQAMWRF
jgi:hypothetical protein